MSLLVGDHLHPMFETAQIAVSFVEFSTTASLYPTALFERRERVERRTYAQIRLPTARDQLLRLDEEFDLANAAASKLQILPRNGDPADLAVRMNLTLHGMDVGDRCEVEIFAPDERRQFTEEIVARVDVAADRPRLDHRGAFPVLANRLVVSVRGSRRKRNLRCPGIGPKAKVGAEHVAVRRPLIEQHDEVARQANEKRL